MTRNEFWYQPRTTFLSREHQTQQSFLVVCTHRKRKHMCAMLHERTRQGITFPFRHHWVGGRSRSRLRVPTKRLVGRQGKGDLVQIQCLTLQEKDIRNFKRTQELRGLNFLFWFVVNLGIRWDRIVLCRKVVLSRTMVLRKVELYTSGCAEVHNAENTEFHSLDSVCPALFNSVLPGAPWCSAWCCKIMSFRSQE